MSIKQLYSFRKKHNIQDVRKTVNEDDLRVALRKCVADSNGQYGSKSLHGMLRGRGIKVGIKRVCHMLREVDPDGVALRSTNAVKRRQYYVPHPNHLIHIDGHHKLIRWGIIIHGGIDGFSR